MDIVLKNLPNETTWVALAGIFYLMGITKGGVGNGLGAISIVFVSLLIDPLLGIVLVLLTFIIGDMMGIIAWWKKWHTKTAIDGMKWILGGVVLGTLFLIPIQDGTFSTNILKIMLAGLGFYLTFRWWRSVYVHHQTHDALSPKAKKILCITGGFTSTTMSSGGIPTMTYVLSHGFSKEKSHATMVLMSFCINYAKVPSYVGLGMMDWGVVVLALSFAPVVFLGIITGRFLHHRINHHTFNMIAYTGVLAGSIKLLYDGLIV